MPFYPPPAPAAAIPYHLDGSQWYSNATSSPSPWSQASMEQMNQEMNPSALIQSGRNVTQTIGLMLATPINITHWIARGNGNGNCGPSWINSIAWSPNSTNFNDGTWTGFTQGPSHNVPVTDWLGNFRTETINNVQAIRLNVYGNCTTGSFGNIMCFLIYGTYALPVDALQIWHPTLDRQMRATDLYIGDVGRNSSGTVTFRVKNVAPVRTANSITVTAAPSTVTSPTMQSQHTASADDVTYTSSINIGNLAAGNVSNVLYFRRTLVNAQIIVSAVRLQASAGSWT